MIPTKEPGIAFKFLREHEILGFIYNGEELGAFDFVVPEQVEENRMPTLLNEGWAF